MRISVIIPAYNEAERMPFLLDDLTHKSNEHVEILVVDQSKDDKTKHIVEQYDTVRYVRSMGNSRAETLNHGAQEATGDILLFLHADCILPVGFVDLLLTVDYTQTPYGAFIRRHEPSMVQTVIADWFGRIWLRTFGYMLGDNAQFVTKQFFTTIGGYWERSLFEDVDFGKKAHRYAKQQGMSYAVIESPVVSSSRKFEQNNSRKVFWLMLFMQTVFKLGVSPERLAQRYRKLK